MHSPIQVLVVANDPELLGYVCVNLTTEEYRVVTVETADEALERVNDGLRPDLVFLDISAPQSHGLHVLQQLKLVHPRSKVVVISANESAREAVEAIRLGARDCLMKPFPKSEFDRVVARCLGPNKGNSSEIEDVGDGWLMVIASPVMRKIRSYCGSVAKVNSPVLILGESGTGKEVVARLIHKRSSRAKGPFLKVNCAAMPAELLESELFGYEPGAFTGATRAKPGKFEQCDRGTILLDEIGEMHPNLQAKLLHVLQDGEFSRLGGRNAIKVDVRVLAATNIDISEALANHNLRGDLYYRLNTFVVRMPPLRERKDEITFLLEHFANQLAAQWGLEPEPLSPALMDACMRYEWPGNIRELESFAKRWQLLRDEQAALAELITSGEESLAPARAHLIPLPPSSTVMLRSMDGSIGKLKSAARSAMGEAESSAISEALARTHWNRKRAAELLDISYKALLYKIKQYGLDRPLRAAGD